MDFYYWVITPQNYYTMPYAVFQKYVNANYCSATEQDFWSKNNGIVKTITTENNKTKTVIYTHNKIISVDNYCMTSKPINRKF